MASMDRRLQAGISFFNPFYLSPLDHLLPPVYITAFISFALQDTDTAVCALREGVYRFLKQRPALGGEIIVTNSKTKTNVRKVQPASSSTLERFPIFTTNVHSRRIKYIESPKVCDKGFTGLPSTFEGHIGHPVIRFQANVMEDGIILAITFFHPAIDGASLFSVLNGLASSIRDPGYPPKDYILEEGKARRHLSQIKERPEQSYSQTAASNKSTDIQETPVSLRLLFSTERLLHIVKTCQDHINQHVANSAPFKISSGDVESAIIWLCIVRARIKAAITSVDEPSMAKWSSLAAAMNVRSSIIPEIPQTYMGNAVVFATASYSVPSMLETAADEWVKLVADLAIQVRGARRGTDKKYVERLISFINGAEDWSQFIFEIPEVLVSNMRHMKVYDLDFGTGLGFVDTFEIHNAGIKGGCWIMPDRKKRAEAALRREFIVAIEPEGIAHLEKDFIIRWLSEVNDSKL